MPRIAVTIAVPDRAGAGRMMFQFSNALLRKGHQVVVIHGPPPAKAEESLMPELEAAGFDLRSCPRLRRPVPPFATRSARRHAKGCDMIIGFNQRDRSVAATVGRSLGIPTIISVQNQHNFWGPLIVPALKKAYYRRCLKQCSPFFVCTSEATRNEITSMIGVGSDRCAVVPNGIELTSLEGRVDSRERWRSKLGVRDDARVFVNVGRLDVQKGQDLLIQAWAATRRTQADRLVLVGDVTCGSQRLRSARFKTDLHATARRLGVLDSVYFAGWQSNVTEILDASDFYVHAARWEGSPLAVLEALSRELPTVTTSTSGQLKGFRDGEHGLIAQGNSVNSLRDCMERLLALTPTAARQMAEAGRTLCRECYSIESVGARFVTIVEHELAPQ